MLVWMFLLITQKKKKRKLKKLQTVTNKVLARALCVKKPPHTHTHKNFFFFNHFSNICIYILQQTITWASGYIVGEYNSQSLPAFLICMTFTDGEIVQRFSQMVSTHSGFCRERGKCLGDVDHQQLQSSQREKDSLSRL